MTNETNDIWNIFIDETYLKEISEKSFSQIVTGYFCIPDTKKEEVYDKYKQLVYVKQDKFEIKSTMVSDKLNRQALLASRGVGAIYMLQQSHLGFESDERLENHFAKLPILLTNYLAPLQTLIKKIHYKSKAADLVVNVYLDEKTQFVENDFQTWCAYFANKFAQSISTSEFKVTIKVSSVRSENSIGIQIADMLCGALRREYIYSKIENHAQIIPFKYLSINREDSCFEDSDFLTKYAIISLNHGQPPTLKTKKLIPEINDNSEVSKTTLLNESKNTLKKLSKRLQKLESGSHTERKQFYIKNYQIFLILQELFSNTSGQLPVVGLGNGNVKKYSVAVNNFFA